MTLFVRLLCILLTAVACTWGAAPPPPDVAEYQDGVPRDEGAVPCTMIFVEIKFTVVDASGSIQDGFELTITNQRTREIYNVTQSIGGPGWYTALNDSFRKQVIGEGEPIRVHGVDGRGRTFDADFVIGADRCHIHKVSGPERVVVN